VSALRTLARVFPEISALSPLFPYSGAGGGNTRSDQIELVIGNEEVFDSDAPMDETDLSDPSVVSEYI